MTKVYNEGKRSNHNITPLLYLKLWRRITYERWESEVDIGGNRGAGHVGDGNIVIFKVFQRGARMRGGAGAGIALANDGILGDHSTSETTQQAC